MKTKKICITVNLEDFVLNYLPSPKSIVAIRKNGWLDRDCVKGTILVVGSINHCPAPAATHIDTTSKTTKNII